MYVKAVGGERQGSVPNKGQLGIDSQGAEKRGQWVEDYYNETWQLVGFLLKRQDSC